MSPKHFIFTLKKHLVQPIPLRVPPNLVCTIKIADFQEMRKESGEIVD